MTSSLKHRARIIDIQTIAADTRIVRVEPVGEAPPPFKPGQYAMLGVTGLDPRAFSIASAPKLPFLEFHIKNSGQGISKYVFEKAQINTEVKLSDPLGVNYWQHSARPLLALAGGVGIAPLKAIVEAQMQEEAAIPVHLYWGARDKTHLYLNGLFEGFSKKHPSFKYIPILSEEKDEKRYRYGMIDTALKTDLPDLKNFDIYMAGPAAMIESLLPVLTEKGAEKNRIFSDFFTL